MNTKQKLERANLALSILKQDDPHKAEFALLKSIVEPVMLRHLSSLEKELDMAIKCGKEVNENEFTDFQKRAIRDMSQTNGCKYTLENCIFMRQLENGGYITIENHRAKLTSKGKAIAHKYQ